MDSSKNSNKPDTLPPSADYLNAPGCDVVVMSPDGKPISASRAAAILMRVAGQDPDAKVEFWMKIRT